MKEDENKKDNQCNTNFMCSCESRNLHKTCAYYQKINGNPCCKHFKECSCMSKMAQANTMVQKLKQLGFEVIALAERK